MFKGRGIASLVLLLAVSACNLSRGPAPAGGVDPDAAHVSDPPGAASAVSATLTPGPAATASATLTPTASLPQDPLISVSMDTNCRRGPGQVYDYMGGLGVGETEEVIAQDPSGQYWYISNPDGPGFCWVWGRYATLEGLTQQLQIFTPEPTPTPTLSPTPQMDFAIYFVALDQCMAMRYLRVKLVNMGSVPWESIKTQLLDETTSTAASSMTSDDFSDASTCQQMNIVPKLIPGESTIVYTQGFNHDLVGHKIKVRVELCTQNGLAGTCLTRETQFIP